MKYKSIILVMLIVFAGCKGKITGPVYNYTGGANSAYISGSGTEGKGLLGSTLKDFVKIISIDGAAMPNDMNLVTFPSLKIERPLAPGRHNIGAIVGGGGNQTANVSITFDAVAGERYVLERQSVFNEGWMSDSVLQTTVWIQDSKGNKVTDMQTVTPVAPSYRPIIMHVPVSK